MKSGILGPSGLHELRRVPSGRERGPDAVLDTLLDVIGSLVDVCRDRGLDPAAVGAVVPGVVDDRGVGRLSVNIGWRDAPIAERLDALGLPVFVGHDVRAGGVAEGRFGAAAGFEPALFVPIGTGIAAALVSGGDVATGATFQAGELGQVLVPVPNVGRVADGSPLVALEDASSARSVAERFAAASGISVASVGADAVEAAVITRDPIAVAVWGEAIDRLAMVLASAIAVADPAVIVLGGGLSRAGASLLEPLGRALADYLPWRTVPPLTTARFADDAGFVGCAIEAWRSAGRDPEELAALLSTGEWQRTPTVADRVTPRGAP